MGHESIMHTVLERFMADEAAKISASLREFKYASQEPIGEPDPLITNSNAASHSARQLREINIASLSSTSLTSNILKNLLASCLRRKPRFQVCLPHIGSRILEVIRPQNNLNNSTIKRVSAISR
jgi:hypothetical protein